MNARLAVFVLFISSIGWGLTWLPVKAMNDMGLDSMHLIFIAFISGTVVLLPWLYRQRALWRQCPGFMLAIGLCGGFANVAFQTAIFHGDVIRVMILFYLLPVWSVIGGRFFLGEKIDGLRALAVLICLSGAFLILDVLHTSWQGISWIDLLAIGSGMGLAATNILFRYTQGIPVISKVAATFIGCSFIIGISLMVTSSTAALPDNSTVAWAALYGALMLSLISLGTQWAVTRIEAGRSAIIIVMELVVAVVSVALIVGAELRPEEIIGGLMVMSAALLEAMRSDEGLPTDG